MIEVLTIQKLEGLQEGIFAQGEVVDSHEGINMTNSGKALRWVAVRGGIADWAIYVQWAFQDYEFVARYGDKVHSEEHIKKLVPCDDGAFSRYRH